MQYPIQAVFYALNLNQDGGRRAAIALFNHLWEKEQCWIPTKSDYMEALTGLGLVGVLAPAAREMRYIS